MRILVPVDGSEESESILPALMPLLRGLPAQVALLQVVDKSDDLDAAQRGLHRLSQSLLAEGILASHRTEWGRPAEEIEYHAREEGFDLLAMATHGRSGLRRVLMGSIAETVLRHASLPVLLTRPGARVGDWRRIVLALDGSPRAEAVFPDVVQLARPLGATVHALTVNLPAYLMGDVHHVPLFPPSQDLLPYLNGVCDRLTAEGVLTLPATADGTAASGIARYAEDIGAGLIACTTHGRSGLARLFLGSVAEDVLRHAPCPLLVRRTVHARVLSRH
ncbi:MAG TPA: universal stress protein [Planctomycetota bacterium]|nr:universal stress protein [Planctomycetota bacterium]